MFRLDLLVFHEQKQNTIIHKCHYTTKVFQILYETFFINNHKTQETKNMNSICFIITS